MDTIPRLHKTRNLFGSQHVYSFWPFLQENSKLDSAHSMLPVPNPSVVPEAEQKNITHIANTTSDRASHPNSTVVEAAAFSNGSDVGTPATTTISVAPTQAGKKCMFGICKFASWYFILFHFFAVGLILNWTFQSNSLVAARLRGCAQERAERGGRETNKKSLPRRFHLLTEKKKNDNRKVSPATAVQIRCTWQYWAVPSHVD